MSGTNTVKEPWVSVESQPADACGLPKNERDSLIVSATQVDGDWVILSRYGDDIWQLEGFTTNTLENHRQINFTSVSMPFRAVMKAIIYRFLRRGRAGQRRPRAVTLHKFIFCLRPFLRHLETLNLKHLGAISPDVCASYVAECRTYRQTHRSPGKQLSPSGLSDRFKAVEALYELSQYTDDPIPEHPWPDTSAGAMAGLTGSDRTHLESTTPLIPDEIFCTLFERALEQVQRGEALLDLRDALAAIDLERKGQTSHTANVAKSGHLKTLGCKGGLTAFNKSIINLRTACYVVLASTSGCRNHELANIRSDAHHRTEDDQGTIYHWMRSTSEKTDAGAHDWMVPAAAVRALRLMDRWAEPFQAAIAAEIAERQRVNPYDPEIAKAQQHHHALFLGESLTKRNQVRTLSNNAWGLALKAFAKDLGLDWNLASHQFRRKFANYVAHSQFGDLRYLREHFAHWSMDMMLSYAMDRGWGQHLDMELYDDIKSELEGIKLRVVDTWISNEPLAGGYGRSIKRWQRDPANLAIFKNHAAMVKSIAESTAIRSNGHAWCSADDNLCVGNTLERTRCDGCNNAVIGRGQAPAYQQLYNNLKELLDCPDIGDGGRQRILRDMERYRDVLIQLGYNPKET